jgi:hypothetical protein
MFKRVIPACAHYCKCPKPVSMMDKYRNVGRYRMINNFPDSINLSHQEKDEASKSSWYQDAKKNDKRMIKYLVIGSAVVGASIYTTYEYSPWKDERNIRDDIIVGSFLGAVAGGGLWIIYPFPVAISSIVGTAVFLNIGPKFIKDYFDATRKVSR